MSGVANVRIEKLTPTNYHSWDGDMASALKLSSLWPAVDGEVADRIAGTFVLNGVVMAATEDDRQMDEKARALIRVNTCKELQVLVDCEDTADKVWRALKRTFTASLTTRLMDLKAKWAKLEQQQSEGVVAFFSRATRIRLDLREVGNIVTDLDFMTQVLHGLLPKFNNFVQNMALTDMTSLSCGEFMNKLQWSETHLEKSRGAGSSLALEAHSAEDEPRGPKCHKCGDFGHIKRDCPLKRGNQRNGGGGAGKHVVRCGHCKKRGHSEETCWEKYPHLRKGKKPLESPSDEDEDPSNSYAEAY